MRGLPVRLPLACLGVLLLAGSAPAAAQTPEQIHVGLGATHGDAEMAPPDVSHLVVSWATLTPYGPQQRPQVRYSIDGGAPEVAPASLVGLARDIGPLTEADAVPQYAARITVPRGSTLTYEVGDPAVAMSEAREARMVPFENEPLRVAVTAWVGSDGYDRATRQRIEGTPAPQDDVIALATQQDPDLVLVAGNLGASTSMHPWDIAMRSLEPLASRAPLMVATGINDRVDDYNQVRSRFEIPIVNPGRANTVLPLPGTPADTVLAADDVEQTYYGFSAGPAYFIVLDTAGLCRRPAEAVATPDTPPCESGTGAPDYAQDTWLHDVLEDAVEDLQAKWLVVLMSESPYVHADDGADLQVVERFVPLFDQYGVDVVLSGGEQLYQRSHPLWNGQVRSTGSAVPADRGTVYVTTALGQVERIPEDVAWLAASYSDYHLTVLDIGRDSLAIQSLALDGSVVDQVVLERDPEAAGTQPDPPQAAPGVGTGLVAALLGLALLRRRA